MKHRTVRILILLSILLIALFMFNNLTQNDKKEPQIRDVSSNISLKTSDWVVNGTVISIASNKQEAPKICSDGAGGAIIAWRDYRSGSEWDIYAQRIDSTGTVKWTTNGVVICNAQNNQNWPQLCSDGTGGAIITWTDNRTGTRLDIYAQRINSTGSVQWITNGVQIATFPSTIDRPIFPQLCYDGAGGAIITWQDGRNSMSTGWDIYAQRVNSIGIKQWSTNGVAICTAQNHQVYPQLCGDNASGAIIAWSDFRNGEGIYAQRVNSTGKVQWIANGSFIAPYTIMGTLRIISDDVNGGAIITWSDYRSGSRDVYAQRINSTGSVQWTINGTAICTAINSQYYPQACTDGAGGAIITWEDYRNGPSWAVYAQKINSTGSVRWAVNGTIICNAKNFQNSSQLCSDGAGGAIITWADNRSASNWNVYAQRINSTGINQWTANGSAICTANNTQNFPNLCSNDVGGAIITWQDYRGGSSWDIYAQRIGPTELFDFEIGTPSAINANPSNWSAINSFTVSWSNPADASGIIGAYYKLDAPPTSRTNGIYVAGANITDILGISVSGSGTHVIYIWLKDKAENINQSQYNTTNLYFDNFIGTPSGVSATPGSWTPNNEFNITWTNPSDLSGIVGVYYKLDAPPTSNTNGTFVAGANISDLQKITVSGNGAHVIYIWLKDEAGNTDYNKCNTAMLYLDSFVDLPMGLFATPSSWTTNNNFKITWTNPNDLSGIVGVYYKLDAPPTSNTNGIFVAGTNITTITGIAVPDAGAHVIYIWLVDNVGNINYTQYASTILYLSENTQQIPFTDHFIIIIMGLLIVLLIFYKNKGKSNSKLQNCLQIQP